MRKTIFYTICYLLCWHFSIAQFEALPADSLIKKLRVKTVTQVDYSNNDSNIVSSNEVWKYNKNSHLISHQVIDKDSSEGTDGSFIGAYYFYNGNRIDSEWNVGVWNTITGRADTVRVVYHYNEKDSLDKIIETEPQADDQNFTTSIEYSGGRRSLEITKNAASGAIDTNKWTYSGNGRTMYNYVRLKQFKYEYKYDDHGRLIDYGTVEVPDTTLYDRSVFYYNNGVIIKSIENNTARWNSQNSNFINRMGRLYFYYPNGLVKEVRELDLSSDDGRIRIYRYQYEFY